jgi:acyl-CoA dehydrogenase
MSTDLTAPPMPDEADLAELRALARSILEKHSADALHLPEVAIPFDASLWETLAEVGLTLLSTPESAGGSGAGLAEALTVLSVAAEYAVPLPLAETDLLAAWLLVEAGLDVPTGPLSAGRGEVAVSVSESGTVAVSGTLQRVPWARHSDAIVVLGSTAGGDVVFLLPTDRSEITAGHNLAHEPRDSVRFDLELPGDAVIAMAGDLSTEWGLRGSLARAAQTCGALESALRLTLEHASTRIQFGRPLGRFQAVQHLAAEAAGEVTLARAACDVAVRTTTVHGIGSPSSELAVAVAKSQAARASGAVSRTAHQVHGAIGFTLDHQLRHFTLRMQAWRSEFGDERFWERRIGELTLAAGAPDVWNLVTAGDPGPA